MLWFSHLRLPKNVSLKMPAGLSGQGMKSDDSEYDANGWRTFITNTSVIFDLLSCRQYRPDQPPLLRRSVNAIWRTAFDFIHWPLIIIIYNFDNNELFLETGGGGVSCLCVCAYLCLCVISVRLYTSYVCIMKILSLFFLLFDDSFSRL